MEGGGIKARDHVNTILFKKAAFVSKEMCNTNDTNDSNHLVKKGVAPMPLGSVCLWKVQHAAGFERVIRC
jgi:hypothetical protein